MFSIDFDWILQEENDSKHRIRLCTSWKAENCFTALDWPSQSPDANPIENVWSVVKRKLAERHAFTLKQLSWRIKEVWRSLPTEYKMHCCAEKMKWRFLQNFPRELVPFLVEQTVSRNERILCISCGEGSPPLPQLPYRLNEPHPTLLTYSERSSEHHLTVK